MNMSASNPRFSYPCVDVSALRRNSDVGTRENSLSSRQERTYLRERIIMFHFPLGRCIFVLQYRVLKSPSVRTGMNDSKTRGLNRALAEMLRFSH